MKRLNTSALRELPRPPLTAPEVRMSAPHAFHAMLEPVPDAAPVAVAVSLDGPVAPRGRPTTKCRRCLTVAAADDRQCVACHAPLGDEPNARPPADRGRRLARFSLVGLAVGTGLGPLAGGSLTMVSSPTAGPIANLILCACLGGGIGAVVAYALGLVSHRQRR